MVLTNIIWLVSLSSWIEMHNVFVNIPCKDKVRLTKLFWTQSRKASPILS